METVELRPLSLGELLDRTFSLYRSNFWLFVGIMAIPSAFVIPMNLYLFLKQGSPIGFRNPKAQAAVFSLGYLAFLILFWLVYSLAVGAATHAVAEAYLGRRTTVRASYARVRKRFWGLLGLILNVGFRISGIFAGILILAALGGGAVGGLLATSSGNQTLMAIVIVAIVVVALLGGGGLAIFLALRYSVSIPAFLFENLGALAAIRRSVQLTKNRKGHIFLAALLAAVIADVGVIIFQGPFWIAALFTAQNGNWPPWLNFLAAAAGAVGGALTGSLLLIVLVLCYYDTRIRKEAFDLQFMMASLDNPPPAPAVVSPT